MTFGRRFCYCIVAFLVLSSGVFAAVGPGDRVRTAIEEILSVLKDPALNRLERWDHIAPIIDSYFDFQAMSQSILATQWKRASRAEQSQFVEFFSQYLESTYREKIEAYTSQRIDFKSERIRDDRALVKTVIVSDAVEIPVDYRLRRANNEQWYAYDVVIEGISLVNNYRATFEAISKSSGMEGILNDVQRRIDKYKKAKASAQ